MSRTITAMFDSRGEAESARSRLGSSGIEAERVRIIDQGSSSSSTSGSSSDNEGFLASLKDLFMPDEDRHAYGEGIRRGGYMLVAEVDESDADRACQLLDDGGSVDFDQRQQEWRNQGWAGFQADRSAGAFGQLSAGQDSTSAMGTSAPNTGGYATAGREAVEEEHIPIVNEELRVGKREVERGGARVRSYIRETPVHEQVNLREEHVEIERRPVGGDYRQGALGEDVFRDREIEMTEHAEEAVVSKEARVQEELVIRKTAEQRTQNIDDTVRHTEVDVDEDRSAFGFDKQADRSTGRTDLERQGSNRDEGNAR